MWQSLAYPWQICLEEAWAAYCSGNMPIGAAVVDAGGNLLARGRNRIHDAIPEGRYLYGQTLAHAEINALVSLEADQETRHTSSLYTTTEPCPLCLGAFYMSSVRTLLYASRDPFAGSVDLLGATPYLSRKLIKALKPQRDDLEAVVVAIGVVYMLDERTQVNKTVLETWQAVMPAGVALGRALHQSGELGGMRERGLEAAEVFNWLERML